MGLLDFLTGNNAAASPWGMLYQQPAPQTITDYAMGYPVQMPASPWGDPAQSSVANPIAPPAPAPAPPATGFGAGATPFGFAGPGSMNVAPSQIAAPAPPSAFDAGAPAVPFASQSAMNANAAAPAPAANDPIAVGNYQMPRIGGGFPADDGEDETPAAARPTSGTLPAAPAGAPSAAPFSLGGAGNAVTDRLGKATRGFFGNMGLGPIGALAGGLGALITGQSTDPTSIANEQANLTAQALVSKGASPADVQAAAKNPTLLKALIDQYYGKDKFKVVQTGENGLGGKTFRVFNEQDGTFKDMPAAPGGAAAGGMNPDGTIGDMSKSGDAYLATVPQAQRNTLQMMLKGDLPPPTSFAMAKPYWQSMIAAAKQVDPNFSETNWAARLAMQKSAQGDGKLGQNLNALTTGIGHLQGLWNAIPGLNNSEYSQTYNRIGNAISTEFGGTGATNFAAIANRVAPEIVKIWRGTGGAEADIKRDIDSLNASNTPSQLRGAIANIAGLMRSKVESNMEEYKNTMGRDLPLTQKQQQALALIDQLETMAGTGSTARGPAPGASSAPALAPGQSTTINGVAIRRVN